MNRVLEFRAWDKVKKEMYLNPFNGKIGSINDIFSDNGDWDYMQYTGLKDKNGVKIFEGDIIKLKDVERPSGISNYKRDILTTVVYDTYSGFNLELIRDGDENLNNYFSSYKLYDVIKYKQHSGDMVGNIHENKEILEQLYNNKEELK